MGVSATTTAASTSHWLSRTGDLHARTTAGASEKSCMVTIVPRGLAAVSSGDTNRRQSPVWGVAVSSQRWRRNASPA
jgi:hypothetical protein